MKLNRAFVPLIALALLIGAALAMGAQQKATYRIPPGDLVDSPNARMAYDVPPRAVPQAPALTEAPLPGALTETFDGTALDKWHGITESPVQWTASEGRLQQVLPQVEGPSEENALFVTRDTAYTDVSVESHFYATAGSPVGMVLRGSTTGYYRVVLYFNVNTNQASKARIERVSVDGRGILTVKTLAKGEWATWPGYDLERWTHMKAVAQGNRISVLVDGREIMSATDADSPLASGFVGVWTLADLGASFDNLRVQPVAGR